MARLEVRLTEDGKLLCKATSNQISRSAIADPAALEKLTPVVGRVIQRARQIFLGMESKADEATIRAVGSAELRKLADALDAGAVNLRSVEAYRHPTDDSLIIIKATHKRA